MGQRGYRPPPPYRRPANPDDQAAGCALLLILFAIFAPIIILFNIANTQGAYVPRAIDVPGAVRRGRKAADYEAIDWLAFFVLMGVMLLGVTSPNHVVIVSTVVLCVLGSIGFELYRRNQLDKSNPATMPPDSASMVLALSKARTYKIYPVKTAPDFVTGDKLIQALLATMPQLTFQIVGEASGITWQVVDSYENYDPKAVEDTLKSYLGHGTQIERSVGLGINGQPTPFFREHLHFELANEYVAPLPFLGMLKAYDPLTAITQRMSLLDAGQHERIIYQVLVTVASDTARTVGARRFEQKRVRTLPGVPRDKHEDNTGLNERLIEEKLASTLYHCFLGSRLKVAVVTAWCSYVRSPRTFPTLVFPPITSFGCVTGKRLTLLRLRPPQPMHLRDWSVR